MTWSIRRLLPELRGRFKRRNRGGPPRDHESASRLKSELLATMSHEIRTPMNAVLGMTDLLRLTDLTRKQLGYLQAIQSSGDMLLGLLDNTLDYARLEAGHVELQSQEFDIAELLERVLQIMGYQAYSKGIELIADFSVTPSPRVISDVDRLRQILVNLISNAIRHSDDGEIVVRVHVEPGAQEAPALSLSVTDQGAGISRELQDRLVIDSDVVVQDGQLGSGLGLTICKRLIDNMGGEIGVTSVPGEGTSVWLTIPVESIVSQPVEDSPRPTLFEGERALVIDSNPVSSEILRRYFQDWGLDCAIATDAKSALSQLDNGNDEQYDVAIIDKDLVGDDGLLLARQIRATLATRDLPILLLTSIAKPLEVGQISLVGNIRCVNKPVLPSELRHELLRLVPAGTEFAVGLITKEADPASNSVSTRQLRVLIAEDNMVNSRMLLAMLCSLGCYPDIVEDGPAALQALAREAYDLVLMDCQMPGLDGDQVTKELRENPSLFRSQPVVIAVTADNSDLHRRRCLDSGMDGFIAKPIRLEKLVSGLEQWPILLGTRDSCAGGAADASSYEDIQSQVRSQLKDRAGAGGADFIHNYIDLFLQDTSARLDKMRRALLTKDTEALGRESHALKGTCLEFGVVRMGQYCDDLRAASNHGNLQQAERLLTMLDNEFARVSPVFEAEKAASS